MTRVVEVSAEGLAGARDDVRATRDGIRDELAPLRWRMSNLNVPTGAMHDVLAVADRLDSDALPSLDEHVKRAQALASLRYGGSMGVHPIVDGDDDPFGRPPSPFTATPWNNGTVGLSWPAAPAQEQEADKEATEHSSSIGSWFGDRWDDVTDAVDEGTEWLGDQATDAWDKVLDVGASIGDWWEETSADLGGWIDENLAGVREFIGKHVAVFRFVANVCRIAGWIVVVVGAILAVGLAIIGAMGGAAIGAVFGFGVGAVPGGGAGALAGLSAGMEVMGWGFALVSAGDFLDVVADWGEGKIDGQDLVKKGTLELAFTLGSVFGIGAIGKLLQKTFRHLPESWIKRIDDWLKPKKGTRVPDRPEAQYGPLHNGAPRGPGWNREPDIEPDVLYGQDRVDFNHLNSSNRPPTTIDPGVKGIGGDLSDPWGINPDTGLPFTQTEWEKRFADASGAVRWPPNRGAVPGSRVEFTDAQRFMELYGDSFDRVGYPGGDFLGVPPRAEFGQRALPPTSLNKPLMGYTFDRRTLPKGMTIEVSEIAPAFGRPGGGIQVRFMEGGKSISVKELLKRGILR